MAKELPGAQDSFADLLKNITIVEKDGTQSKMTDEQAESMAEALNAASERYEAEGPRFNDVARRLSDSIPGLKVDVLGGYCPVQAEGQLNGEEFYFRARGTHASLSVGSTDGNPPSSFNPRLYATVCVTGPGDLYGAGWLTPEQVEVIFPILVANLEVQSPEENQAKIDQYHAAIDELINERRKGETQI